MKPKLTSITQHLWVFFAPLCWLLGLAMSHELFSSSGSLRSELTTLVSWLQPSPSPEVIGLAGLLISGLGVSLILWLTHLQNRPTARRPLLHQRPELTEVTGSLALLVGAVILGSELNNAITHMQGATPALNPPSEAELEAWRAALKSPWGLAYELALLPIAECFIFHHVVQRCVPIPSAKLRIAYTALAMTIFSWRLAASPFLVNLCAAWLFERVRSTELSLAFYLDYQLIAWLVAVGWGPQVEGFDLLSAPWQPWTFNLIGLGALIVGIWLIEKTPPCLEKRSALLWDELKREMERESERTRAPRDEDEP